MGHQQRGRFPFFVILAILPIYLFLWGLPEVAFSAPPAQVLVLQSYHQGYKWTDDITQGILQTFEHSGMSVQVHLEYMDTKKAPLKELEPQLVSLYKKKYGPASFDLLLSADDNAFTFLMKHRETLFGDTPWVFCGVNYLEPTRLTKARNLTGVNEAADLWRGIDLALRLHPNTEKVYFVYDRTPTGARIEEHLEQILPNYQDQIEIVRLDRISMKDLEEVLSQAAQNSLVFYSFFFRDQQNQFFEYDESIQRVVNASPVPVYIAWDFSIGSGAVGGYLTSGIAQGEAAAQMGLRVLAGENASEIPPQLFSPNRYVFDYRALERFKIPMNLLPEGSTILNQPSTSYKIDRETFGIAVAGIIAGLAILVMMIMLNLMRHRSQRLLKVSEARLRNMVENLPAGAIYSDEETFSFNRAAEDWLGYARNEIDTFAQWRQTIFGPNYEETEALWRQEERYGFPRILRNLPIFDSTGGRHYCDLSVYQDEKRYVILLYDTTDRKETEEALTDSELRHRTLADSLPMNVFVKSSDLVYTFCNAAYASLLKLPPGQVLGKSDFDLHPPEQARWYQQSDKKVLSTREMVKQDEILVVRGQRRTIHTIKVPLPDREGGVAGVVGIFWDVTEERKAEQALREALAKVKQSKEQMDIILQTVSDGLIVSQRDGHVRVMNDAAQALYQKHLHTTGGDTIDEIFDGPLNAYLTKLYSESDPPMVADLKLKNGRRKKARILEARSNYLTEENDRRSGAVTLLREVTEERELVQLKNEFLSMAAHELRTPMTSVMGYSELLLENEFPEDQVREFIQEIYDSSQALDSLVGELLDVVRIESGRPIPMDLVPCELHSVLAKAVKQISLRYPDHNFQLISQEQPPEDVLADAGKMRQVIDNILSNAAKYSHKAGEIQVIEEAESSLYRVRINDNGIGMTNEQASRIFDRFYRAEQTEAKIPGLGIGMSIVKAIVDAHDGKLSVNSDPGEGTEVTVELPRQTPEKG